MNLGYIEWAVILLVGMGLAAELSGRLPANLRRPVRIFTSIAMLALAVAAAYRLLEGVRGASTGEVLTYLVLPILLALVGVGFIGLFFYFGMRWIERRQGRGGDSEP